MHGRGFPRQVAVAPDVVRMRQSSRVFKADGLFYGLTRSDPRPESIEGQGTTFTVTLPMFTKAAEPCPIL
jgi:signal transduction histidine kinase